MAMLRGNFAPLAQHMLNGTAVVFDNLLGLDMTRNRGSEQFNISTLHAAHLSPQCDREVDKTNSYVAAFAGFSV